MFVAVDAQYDDPKRRAVGAAILFERWESPLAASELTCTVENVQPYVPGEFFRRELPVLLQLLKSVDCSIDVIVIDGYVQLNDRPGLGKHLLDALDSKIPVIGVAKTRYQDAKPREILRGSSKAPLFVTSEGSKLEEAALCIQRMHGEYRIPTLLNRVDRLAKEKLSLLTRKTPST